MTRLPLAKMQSFSGMEEEKLDSGGDKQRSSQIKGEESWGEYNQCCEDLCEIALISVHEEGTASADSAEGMSQLSIPSVCPLLERDSTSDVKHVHFLKLGTSVVTLL